MIEGAIRDFIVKDLNYASQHPLSDDFPLLERGVVDSLGLFHLVEFIESQFDVIVEDEELIPRNFGTIHDIAWLVEAKRSTSDV